MTGDANPRASTVADITRVAKVRLCNNESCSNFQDPHLSVQLEHVAVEHGKAVALSYNWGEFHRTNVKVGHTTDGRSLTLNLGQEWFPRDLIHALADICLQHEACWIDQLCVP